MQNIDPHRRPAYDAGTGGEQADRTARQRAARSATAPIEREEQQEKIDAGRDREKKQHHIRDVLSFEGNVEHHRRDAESDGRSAGQRWARHHGEDGGEGHRLDEAQEQIARHHVRQMDGGHVVAAAQAAAWVQELRFPRDERDTERQRRHRIRHESAR